jgi:hypothetical protein
LDPIRVHYIQEFTRLSLWYANKRLQENLGDLEDTVNLRVNLYRNTSLYDGNHRPATGYEDPVWNEIVAKLGEIFNQHGNDSEAVETKGLAFLWPLMEARIREKGNEQPKLGDRSYECWNHDYKREGTVSIHIANVYQPGSPLSDMLVQFAASLIRLLRDSQVRRPDVNVVRCGSWMNSAPRFQMLFPNTWKQSAEKRKEIRYTMGTWGQFMDRRGDFHKKNGAILRQTGEMPFASSLCWCTTEEALDHLQETFPEAVAYNKRLGYIPSA